MMFVRVLVAVLWLGMAEVCWRVSLAAWGLASLAWVVGGLLFPWGVSGRWPLWALGMALVCRLSLWEARRRVASLPASEK